jgi:hypothetical protein
MPARNDSTNDTEVRETAAAARKATKRAEKLRKAEREERAAQKKHLRAQERAAAAARARELAPLVAGVHDFDAKELPAHIERVVAAEAALRTAIFELDAAREGRNKNASLARALAEASGEPPPVNTIPDSSAMSRVREAVQERRRADAAKAAPRSPAWRLCDRGIATWVDKSNGRL